MEASEDGPDLEHTTTTTKRLVRYTDSLARQVGVPVQ